MALPAILEDKLRLPAVGAPLFIISHPALVIAQCKAGIVGAFPALNARPDLAARRMAARDHRGARRARPRPSRAPCRALRRQPDRAQVERAARRGHGADGQVEGADRHHLARRARGRQHRGARLWRNHAARHHHRPLRPQGDREGRRRPDRGRGGRRRPRRLDLALRARPGHPRLVRRAAAALGRDRHRPGDPRGCRRWAPTSPISARPSSPPRKRARSTPTKQAIVAGDASAYRRLEPLHRDVRQLSQALDRQRGARSGKPARGRRQDDELHLAAAAPKPRSGATSGAAARASAPSNRCSRSPNWWRASSANMRKRKSASADSARRRRAEDRVSFLCYAAILLDSRAGAFGAGRANSICSRLSTTPGASAGDGIADRLRRREPPPLSSATILSGWISGTSCIPVAAALGGAGSPR